MASYRKRGSKYDVRWRDPDGRERTRTCPDLATAKALIRDVESSHALGRRWEPGHAAASPLLTVVADKYLAWRATRKRRKTIKNDDIAIDQFIEFLRGKHQRYAEALTFAHLVEWDTLLRQRNKVKPRTANTYVGRVRRFMAWAAASPVSPALGFVVPPPELDVMELPVIPWTSPTAARWSQLDAAIACAPLEWLRDAFIVMRFTGLRQGQVMALLFDDFFEIAAPEGHADQRPRPWLNVRPELGKSRQEREGRAIPVSRHLMDWFAGRQRVGFLVGPHKREREIDKSYARDAWRATGIPEKVWSGRPDHCFRHAFESGLVSLGADYMAVERLLGHVVAKGSGAAYLDPTWTLRLQDAVDLVPPLDQVVELGGRASRGISAAWGQKKKARD